MDDLSLIRICLDDSIPTGVSSEYLGRTIGFRRTAIFLLIAPRTINIVMAEAASLKGQQPVPKLTEAHLSTLEGALKSKPPYCSGVVDVAPEELVLVYGTGREAW